MATREEQVYFDTLRRISKEYMTPDELRRKGPSLYGLDYEECLEMAYENMQADARSVIHGKRRPTVAK